MFGPSAKQRSSEAAIKLACGKGLRLVEFLCGERPNGGMATLGLRSVVVTSGATATWDEGGEEINVGSLSERGAGELRCEPICVEAPQTMDFTRITAIGVSREETASSN
jgi:hypothetical protein